MNDLKTVWKTQPLEESNMMSLSDIRARADRFQTYIRKRNVIFYAYALFNIIAAFWLISRG